MAKKKKYSPNFTPEHQPKMSNEEKDKLFVHIIRLKGFFEEGLPRLPVGLSPTSTSGQPAVTTWEDANGPRTAKNAG